MANEDPEWLAYVRGLPCCACSRFPAGTAHHLTGAGMGLRAHDHETIPLCAVDHDDFHRLAGRFKGWNREQRRSWQREMLAQTRPERDPGAF